MITSHSEQLPNSPPQAEGYNEAFASLGHPRAHWRGLLDFLYAGGPELPRRLWEETSRLLREAGVTFGPGQKVASPPITPLPLDPLPLILHREEWTQLEMGIRQRFRMLSALHADLHGPQQALRQGVIPADLIFHFPGFHPATHTRQGKTGLPVLYALNLIRDPSGNFQVVSDSMQLPSGHGLVLQSRRVMNRLYTDPRLFGHVASLLPFFRTLRSDILAQVPQGIDNPHVVLFTSGVTSPNYFENAILAHYLGFILVQGNDLAVRGGRVRLKTLNGLLPVEVLLRRLNEEWCDPLEFREESLLGVTGLAQAARNGRVSLVNPLGCSILENPALQAYASDLTRFFLGEESILTGPKTYWMADPQHRRAAMEQNMEMEVFTLEKPAIPGQGKPLDEAMEKIIQQDPAPFVVRRCLSPSTAPMIQLDRDGVIHKPIMLRMFLTSNGTQQRVMSGGLAQVLANGSPGLNGALKDVWIFDPKQGEKSRPRIGISVHAMEPAPMVGLPSRVAENLFWIGRYCERSESIMRLFREIQLLQSEDSGLSHAQRQHARRCFLLAFTHLTATNHGYSLAEITRFLMDPEPDLRSALLDSNRVGSLAFSLQSLIHAAQSVRDHLSADTWQVVDNLEQSLGRIRRRRLQDLNRLLWETGPLLQGLTAFVGLTWENMTRDPGWHFLDMGRRLERSVVISHLLEHTLGQGASEAHEMAVMERLLAMNDTLASYRHRFRNRLEAAQVLEKLLQDETDPRAMIFQLLLMENHVRELPVSPEQTLSKQRLHRSVFKMVASVRMVEPEALAALNPLGDAPERKELVQVCHTMRHLLTHFSETIANSYFRHAKPSHLLFKPFLDD